MKQKLNRFGTLNTRIKKLLVKVRIAMVLILLSVFTAMASVNSQQNVVTGNVTEAKTGEPIPGVTVMLKGTSTGTITDVDGNYSISSVPSDATLLFSFVGLKAQETQVGGRSVIDVTMEADAIGIEEVVAIGYGTAKRKDITGSVASLGADEIVAAPVADVAQALKGKLAGVTVTTQDGRPGANVAIRVRGGGSISQSNDPLFIVDGFPVNSISNIPSTQIESIDVLKDASSTAIYGARGANGVIIVTTKSGSKGAPKVTYDGYAQFNTIPEYIPVMDGYDYIAFNWAYAAAIGEQYADAWEKLWAIGRYEGSNSQGIDYYKNVNSSDFTKELYNEAFTHNHNLNISGGSEKTKYLIGLNHIDQDGMKVGSFYKRSNASIKINQELSDNIKLTLNTRYSQVEEGDNAGNSQAYWFRPISTENVLGDMDLTSNTQLGDYDYVLQDVYNPAALVEDTEISNVQRSLVANTSLSWEIVKGLTAKTDLGISTNWAKRKSWSGAIASNYLDGKGEAIFGGDATIRASEGWNYRWVNTLNYVVQRLGEDHDVNILAGYEVADSGSEYIEMSGNEYPASYNAERAWANMNAFHRKEDGSENFELHSNAGAANRLQSFFGRTNYTFREKYLLTATFRADGSSRFAESNRWGYFPAGAVAWRMSEEGFMQDLDWLDMLKLRVSVGSVGSDGISAELWKQSWTEQTTRYSINEVRQAAYVPASELIANPDLKWETTITRNLGVDYTLWGGKLSGSIEVYKNTVNDLLLVSPVSDLTGFQYTQENIGSTSNRGVEISFRGDIVRVNDFNLRGSININVNRNKVEELSEGINGEYSSGFGGVRLYPRNDYYLTEGDPVGLMRGFIHDGWYTTDDFNYDAATNIYTLKDGVPDMASGVLPNVYGTFENKPGSQTAYPGVQKLIDINGDVVIDDGDLGVIGNANPSHTGGFSLNGNYKNIDFGFDFNWSYGNDIYNATHIEAYLGNKESGLFRNRFQELAGQYKIYDIVDGQLTKVLDPSALDALNANASTYLPYAENAVMSTFGIEDGSFLRLNTVTLGYTIPNSVLNKIGISKFRVYGSIYNALTWTNYSGFDPEVNVDETRSDWYPTPGLDYTSYPRARSFTLGINLEF